MARKISKLQVLAALRKLLIQKDTKVFKRKLNNACADSRWLEERNPDRGTVEHITNLYIRVDPRRDGLVRSVLHELLHAYMAQKFDMRARFIYDLEEPVILALEKVLFDYLQQPKHAHLLTSWARAIERKTR